MKKHFDEHLIIVGGTFCKFQYKARLHIRFDPADFMLKDYNGSEYKFFLDSSVSFSFAWVTV